MGRIIKAELKQVFKKRYLIPGVLLFHAAIFFCLFFQKAINPNSGLYRPEIVTPFYMLAFSGALNCNLALISMGILCAALGSDCFTNNTCAGGVLTLGRLRLWLAKLLCTALFALGLTVFTLLMGLVGGLLVNPTWENFSLIWTLKYLVASFLLSLSNGLFAFLLAFCLRKAVVGVIGNLVLFVWLPNMIPKLAPYLPGNCIGCVMSEVFALLPEQGDTQIHFTSIAGTDLTEAILMLIAFFVLEVLAVCAISSKREYTV